MLSAAFAVPTMHNITPKMAVKLTACSSDRKICLQDSESDK